MVTGQLSSFFLLTMTLLIANIALRCGSFLLFMFHACHTVVSVHCSLVITCWERAGFLALLYVMFSCVIVTFSCGVLGQAWYFIVLIPDLCLLPYFDVVACRKLPNILVAKCDYFIGHYTDTN